MASLRNAIRIVVLAGNRVVERCSAAGAAIARAFRHALSAIVRTPGAIARAVRNTLNAIARAIRYTLSAIARAFRNTLSAIARAFRNTLARLLGIPENLKVRVGRFTGRVGRPIIVVSLLGIAVTVVAFQAVTQYSRDSARREFDRQSAHYLMVLRTGLDRYVGMAEAARQQVTGPADEADRWEFFEFAKATLPRYAGVDSLAWVPRVKSGDIARYEQAARDDGLFDYHTSRYGTDRLPLAVEKGKEYFPVFFVEPYQGNEALLGVDLASVPEYSPVLDRARATGRMAAGFSGIPGRDSEHGLSMLLALPVYKGKEPHKNEQSPEVAPEGFLVVTLALADVLDHTLDEFTTPAWLDTYVYSVGNDLGERLLHYRRSPLRGESVTQGPVAEPDESLETKVSYEVAGVELLFVARSVPGTLISETGVLSLGVALVGVLLTALLVQLLYTLRRRQKSAEKVVQRRTAELMEANESNAALERDIEERARMEAELRTAKKQADAANKAKSEFLAVVSHELRTPLNAIIGFSEMLMYETYGPLGDGRYNDYAQDIRGSGLHLLSLINNILDLSKVEADKFELVESEVDVANTAAEALKFVKGRAETAGIHTETDFSERLPELRADARAVMQILVNLLSNAVKFTPRDGRVTVGAELAGDGGLVVSVSDTGIGIPETELLRVLEPFAQSDTTLSREYEGTGLGLPLSKRLIELHDGSLEIESKLGMGTTVRVVFPPSRVLDTGADIPPRKVAATGNLRVVGSR